jgi:hypothetical protein
LRRKPLCNSRFKAFPYSSKQGNKFKKQGKVETYQGLMRQKMAYPKKQTFGGASSFRNPLARFAPGTDIVGSA